MIPLPKINRTLLSAKSVLIVPFGHENHLKTEVKAPIIRLLLVMAKSGVSGILYATCE